MRYTQNINLPIVEDNDLYSKEINNLAFEKIDEEIQGLADIVETLDSPENSIADVKKDINDIKSDVVDINEQLDNITYLITPDMDTNQIQAILDKYKEVKFVDGEFNVNPLFIRSNSIVNFSPNTIIKANAGYTSQQCLLNINNVTNVTIYGNNGVTKMLKTEYKSGEWRHCVNIIDSHNISIYDLKAKDSGGDGFYVGGSSYSSNISLVNCIADNNRRQGLSIVSVKNLLVQGGEYNNTNGTNPAFGIDIEPNYDTDKIENININNVKTSGNARGGLTISLLKCGQPISINISNYTSVNDSIDGVGAILLNSSPGKNCQGSVNINNINIIESKGNGLYIQDWSDYNAKLNIDNIYISNCGFAQSLSENKTNNGIFIADTLGTGNYNGDITINNVRIIDDRENKIMFMPIFNLTTKLPCKNIKISNLETSSWKAGYLSPVYFHNKLNAENIVVEYKNDNIVYPLATSSIVREYLGSIISNKTKTELNINLPPANTNNGLSYKFKVEANGYIRVNPQASDTIVGIGNTGDGVTSRDIGNYIELKSNGSSWYIVNKVGEWYKFNGVMSLKQKNIQGVYSSMPTSGNWNIGDYVQKETYSISGNKIVKGWIRVTNGSENTLGTDWIEDYVLTT